MRIRQLLSLFATAALISIAPLTLAQDYTPSAAVNAAIVDAQSDGVITDAEAIALAQAMASDGASATQVATSMQTNVGTNISSAQIAAGLAATGQTQAQVAAALTTSGAVDNDADAAQAAAVGQQTAIASGNAVVVTNNVATVSNSNIVVTGSGLITDSNGRAVVVKTSADQIFLIVAIIRNNVSATGGLPDAVARSLLSVVNSNPSLGSVAQSITNEVNTLRGGTNFTINQDSQLNTWANTLVSQLPPGTITAQS